MKTLIALALLVPQVALAGALGPCGTPDADTPAAQIAPASSALPAQTRVPLPGEKAPNFELQAVVGKDQVKTIKLSDYEGKWRVVCFYPADFTFV